MTPEQERFWKILKLDPGTYAHDSGHELKSKRFNHKIANKHMEFIMANFEPHQVMNIIKTWLNVYQLPLNAAHLECFDKFHRAYGHYIHAHAQDIVAY